MTTFKVSDLPSSVFTSNVKIYITIIAGLVLTSVVHQPSNGMSHQENLQRHDLPSRSGISMELESSFEIVATTANELQQTDGAPTDDGLLPNFWAIVEREIGTVDVFIQNILRLKNIDNHVALREVDEGFIDELETFAKSEEYRSHVPPGKLQDFYGDCASFPDHFSFAPGERNILMSIIQLSKNDEMWTQAIVRNAVKRKYEVMNEKALNYEYNGMSKRGRGGKGSSVTTLINDSLERNSEVAKNHRGYEEALLDFATYLYLTGGLHAYTFAEINIALPSISTIHRRIKATKSRVEGVFEVDRLVDFLKAGGYPFRVVLGEDATAVKRDVKYNARENQLTGFVVPLDKDGMPKVGSFPVTCGPDIKRYIENNKYAGYLYVVMAQPLAAGAPPFCLAAWGTDSAFTFEDVLNRWLKTTELLESRGISVEGIAADADPRLWKAMRFASGLGKQPRGIYAQIDGYCSYNPKGVSYVSDVVHLLTKLKTRLLKISIVLPLGSHLVSLTHILSVVTKNTREKHFITLLELDSTDKMNYELVLKLCDTRLIDMLRDVIDSEGTREYLRMMNLIMHAYLSTELNPLERLYCIWRPVFFSGFGGHHFRRTRTSP